MTSTSARSSNSSEEGASLEGIYRSEWGRLLSVLVARTRRLDLAEDALSEAFAKAALRWPIDGIPSNPGGWLYTTAHRHHIGRLRAEAVAGRKAPLLAVRPGWAIDADPLDETTDDRLHLILLCCHPALPPESRSALALRLVIGTSTEQIARLFLVSSTTMAARLTRAKKKIAVAGIPLGAPVEEELQERLDEVCRTIYLAFTAGYAPSAGHDLLRHDLAGDAVQLAEILRAVAPDAPQVQALAALLLLQHSRRDARVRDGQLVTLVEQDRSLWRRDEIESARVILSAIEPTNGYAEELRLQALIAAEHARSRRAADTNWTAIARHYETLETITGSAIVRLNRAVAVAEAVDAAAGLAMLSGLEELLAGNHRVFAVRADLALRVGDRSLARVSYEQALHMCTNEVECSFLQRKLQALGK